MLWPLSVVLVANTNGRLAIPALAGLLVISRQHTDARYRYTCVGTLSVCLSVRDVPVLDENGLTYCNSFFHRIILYAQSF